MTLLESVQKVADEVGYQIDTAVIGSNDPMTVKLLAIANRIVGEMAERYAWTKLFRSYSFTLEDGEPAYALPPDFSHYHYETWWNATRRWKLEGAMSPQDEAEIAGYGLDVTTYQRFQIRGISDTQILISPEPTSSDDGEEIILRYLAKRYVRPQTWLVGTTFAAGAYCYWNGNYYVTDTGGSGGSAPVHTTGTTGIWTYFDAPYETFLADTDVPILSERILQQGMIERTAERQAVGAASRFDQQLESERAKDMPGKIIYAGGARDVEMIAARNGTVVFGRIR